MALCASYGWSVARFLHGGHVGGHVEVIRMEKPPGAPPPEAARDPYARLIAVVRWTQYSVLICGSLLLLALAIGYNLVGTTTPTRGRQDQAPLSDEITLDIMPVKPGGPATNYAAYLPSTTLSAPAQQVVTVTIRNFDLDPARLPANSPATKVEGTVGGVAYADGQAYTSLGPTSVAHTFTVPALRLNVPIPGFSGSGKRYVTVTFRVRTGSAGVYAWRCMAPCGDGQDGQAGSMADESYMRGALVVM
jgi:hypothetical protein